MLSPCPSFKPPVSCRFARFDVRIGSGLNWRRSIKGAELLFASPMAESSTSDSEIFFAVFSSFSFSLFFFYFSAVSQLTHCLSPSSLSPRVVFHCHRVVRTPLSVL